MATLTSLVTSSPRSPMPTYLYGDMGPQRALNPAVARDRPGRQFISSEMKFFGLANSSVEHQMVIRYISITALLHQRRSAVKSLLDFDLHDLAVMVGTGSFVSAAAATFWQLTLSSPMPTPISIALAAAGFAAGRFLSARSGRPHAGR